jgi:hypothetical protein
LMAHELGDDIKLVVSSGRRNILEAFLQAGRRRGSITFSHPSLLLIWDPTQAQPFIFFNEDY